MSEVTGKQVFAWFAGGFGLIIAVNVYMAVQAVRTFPGMEVKNSYVASQTFDAEREAQERLGWTASVEVADGALWLHVTDKAGAVYPASAVAKIGRSTEAVDDQGVTFERRGEAMVAPLVLPAGQWVVWLEAEAEDGTAFRQRLRLRVE
jgi:nitrogen fixation protein FixH